MFDPDEKPKTIYSIREIEQLGYVVNSIIEWKEKVKKVYADIKDGEGRRLPLKSIVLPILMGSAFRDVILFPEQLKIPPIFFGAPSNESNLLLEQS